jgi:hypothetical protein
MSAVCLIDLIPATTSVAAPLSCGVHSNVIVNAFETPGTLRCHMLDYPFTTRGRQRLLTCQRDADDPGRIPYHCAHISTSIRVSTNEKVKSKAN